MILDFFLSITPTSSAFINTLIQAAAFEAAVFLGVPALGLIIECVVVRTIREALARYVFGSAEPYFSNYLLFPGVMIHELSHAFFALITGAKITELALFKPEGNSLGHVSMIARGNTFTKALQRSLSACAPVVSGSVFLLLIYYKLIPTLSSVAQWVFVIYLMISILFHMNMSPPDLKCYFKGSGPVLILALPICIVLFLLVG